MCGRYNLEFDEEFYNRYRLLNKLPVKSNYNVAPSQIMPVVVAHSPNTMEYMIWGLIPFWEEKKEKPFGLINVRDDTIITKPWAHKYLQFQRCLIPSTGFFEWKRGPKEKIPFRFKLKNKKYFSFAGLYSSYKHRQTNEEIKSYSIITTGPNELMAEVHNRMPVILKEEDEQSWLNPDMVEIDEIKKYLNPFAPDEMESYRVSNVVNRPANNTPDILKPVLDKS